MSDEDSVSVWIGRLKSGDEDAAAQIWQRYYRRQVGLARTVLRDVHGAADEDDAAQSAYRTFCARVVDGKFPQLETRDDLWRILATITYRKALKVSKKERRHAALPMTSDEDWQDNGPSPELAEMTRQELSRLFELLGDTTLRVVAYSKLEGLTNREIAQSLGKSIATVERKLNLIRQIWSQEDDRQKTS
ncbi:MAG: ECF-type sigma factor [Pirellulaceae bacterium]|nr:hypothetical protein [Planctomycetales bacterium]